MRNGAVFFSYGFRPFFLAAGIAGSVLIPFWLLTFFGAIDPLSPLAHLEWHVHEMLFGFVGAALAGFLLTAIPSWTGRKPVQGRTLAWLAASWVAGRLAMSLGAGLPPWVPAIVDMSFPIALFGLVVLEIRGGANRRNYPVAAIVGAFALCNVAFHLGAGRIALDVALHIMLLLVVVIGGRVIPAFTGNWMRARGLAAQPKARSALEAMLFPASSAVGLADAFAPGHWLSGSLALAFAAVNGFRMAGWKGLCTWRDPLLFVLHVAYAWLVLGYGILGLAAVFDQVPRSAGLHALAAGAIGTMVLAIMSRAALGHTGRALRASAPTVMAYVLVTIGAMARVMAGIFPGAYPALALAGGMIWAAGLLLFALVYFPILTRPGI